MPGSSLDKTFQQRWQHTSKQQQQQQKQKNHNNKNKNKKTTKNDVKCRMSCALLSRGSCHVSGVPHWLPRSRRSFRYKSNSFFFHEKYFFYFDKSPKRMFITGGKSFGRRCKARRRDVVAASLRHNDLLRFQMRNDRQHRWCGLLIRESNCHKMQFPQ